jgi:hypothetical protein
MSPGTISSPPSVSTGQQCFELPARLPHLGADGRRHRFGQRFDLRPPIRTVGRLLDHAKPLDPAQDDVRSTVL